MAGKLTKRSIEQLEATGSPYFAWDAGDGAVKGFGVVVTAAGKRSFVAQFRIGGGRAGKSRRVTIGAFGPWTVEQARDRARELLREASLGIDRGAVEKATQVANEREQEATRHKSRLARDLRLNRLSVRFLREHVTLKRKAATVRSYRSLLALHILPALGRKDAREISRQDVAALHNRLSDRPATANRVVAVLSAIYGWAEGKEILPEGSRNPTRKLERYHEEGKERYLSADELERLGAAIRLAVTTGVPWRPKEGAKSKHIPKADPYARIDPGAASALRLLLFTGARLREILHLEWRAVDMERGLLRLADSKTGKKTILLNAPARAVLAALPQRGRFVFPGESRTGEEQPRTDLKRPWALVCRAAGISDVRLHDLRHSFASVGAGDGHGLVVLVKLLGHSQVATTQRYAHLADDPLRQAADAIANKIAAAMGDAKPTSAEVIPMLREGR